MTIGAQSFAFIRSLIALSRHRAGANQFGVRLGDIRALAKKIGPSHELALSLWETDNIDARLLATLLIKPKSLSAEEMNRMVRSVTFVQVADWLNAYVVKQHPGKETLRQKWMMTNHRWAARADPVVQRTMNGSLAAIGNPLSETAQAGRHDRREAGDLSALSRFEALHFAVRFHLDRGHGEAAGLTGARIA